MNYQKEVIEEAEALIETHRPYAYFKYIYDIKCQTKNSIKAALVSIDYAENNCHEDAIGKLQQVKEYLETKLKEV